MNKTETKSTVLLKHHLKALKLPTMNAECEKIAARAAQDNVDHLAFLLQLCELELIERERKAAERRLKVARFPAVGRIDEFDFPERPSVNKPLMLQLVQGEYLDRRENILLVGPSGTGKSHLATALGIATCGQGRRSASSASPSWSRCSWKPRKNGSSCGYAGNLASWTT